MIFILWVVLGMESRMSHMLKQTLSIAIYPQPLENPQVFSTMKETLLSQLRAVLEGHEFRCVSLNEQPCNSLEIFCNAGFLN